MFYCTSCNNHGVIRNNFDPKRLRYGIDLNSLIFLQEKFNLILGYSFDDTIVTWILTVLLILFMYSVGIAAVSFPWVLMGKIHR